MVPRSYQLLWPVLLGLWFSTLLAAAAEDPTPPISRAADVLALPSDVAGKHLPVRLTGIVTASEPDWEGRFFLNDESGGVFVVGTDTQPQVGDSITIEGVSNRGAFAPVVGQARWKVSGKAALPPAKPAQVDRMMAGVEDGQRVEFTGTARSVYFAATRKLAVDVAFAGHRLHVFPKLPPQMNPEALVGAKVRVRGTVAASFNAALRQLTSINVFVPTPEDFTIEEPEARPPFNEPILPMGEIARYRPDINRGGRIHVRGTVTLYRPGLDLYVQDDTGGLHIETTQAVRLNPGDTVEAVGFLDIAGFRPVLEDARCRRIEAVPKPVAAIEVPFTRLREGLHASELITLRGKVVGRTAHPVHRDTARFVGTRTISTIQNADLTFTVECDHIPENKQFEAVPLGSTVAVTGVAAIETGDDGQLKALTLIQRTPDDMQVLSKPSWFTPPRLMGVIIALLIMSVAGFAWSVSASKKNAMLSFLVAEREKAQRELQHAHDQLEQRVKERTEQLKVEMTARKSSELEFKATLAERTRLARDLHDTLEQALTGIALQLDITAKLLSRTPAEAEKHLELARGFMRQSQVELRRSIWDLRSRELEEFDLAKALLHTSRHIANGTALRVDLETEGTPRPMPEIVEENVLRIGQEAITNVVKHSGATLATLRLTFDNDGVKLVVRDNGTGLSPEKVKSDADKHFGLLGMSERSKRLGGRFSVVGAPGEGTTVTVWLPVGSNTHSLVV